MRRQRERRLKSESAFFQSLPRLFLPTWQKRQRAVQCEMHVQSCCFAHVTYSFLFFFSHVLVVVASLDLKVPNVQWANNSSVCALRKWANFTLTWERGRQGDKHYCDPTIYLYSSNVHSLLLTNWVTWYKGQKVRKEEKSTFFHIFFFNGVAVVGLY